MPFADAVHRLRKARGWTLTELEHRTADPATGRRIHAGTLGNIERGKHPNPTEKTVHRLAQAFGITVPELRRAAGLDTADEGSPAMIGESAFLQDLARIESRLTAAQRAALLATAHAMVES